MPYFVVSLNPSKTPVREILFLAPFVDAETETHKGLSGDQRSHAEQVS